MKAIAKVVLLLMVTVTTPVGADDLQAAEEKKITALFDQLESAWRAGDGNAWADAFVEDADFTVWFGLGLNGREQIAFGHQMIFDNFYAGTVFDMTIRQVRFVRPDVAIVHLNGSVLRDADTPPAEPDAVPMAVLEREGGDWRIVAFQNTAFVVNEFRNNGDIKRFKQFAGEYATRP